MKKILLTHQEKVAVRATRRVWVGVLKDLKAGKQGSEIEVAQNCALCGLESVDTCKDCPYYQVMGYACHNIVKNNNKGHFDEWLTNPTLRTCKSIISLIDKGLKNSKALREKKRK